MQEARPGAEEKPDVLNPLPSAQSKQARGLPYSSCSDGSTHGNRHIVLAKDDLRIECEMFVEVVMEAASEATAPIAHAIEIIEVKLKADLIARNFPEMVALSQQFRRNRAAKNQKK